MSESRTKRDERLRANDVLQRAQRGDQKAVVELERLIDTKPDLWNGLGDLARQATWAWLELISGGIRPLSEATAREMNALRLELAGPSPTPLERLLADRVVLCWLQVHHADMACARAEGLSIQRGDYYQRRQERAQRRYLSAIRSLACVRRLLLPGVQVNIAAPQVNVAGGDTQS